MSTLCVSCTQGPSDEGGHIALAFQVEGPFPGHHIFRCDECGRVFVQQGGLTLAVPAVQPARRPEPDLESGG